MASKKRILVANSAGVRMTGNTTLHIGEAHSGSIVSEPVDKSAEIVCHNCKTETHHSVVHESSKSGTYSIQGDNEGQESGRWSVRTEVLKCLGCREVSIRRIEDNSEGDYPSVDFFPPRKSPQRLAVPPWVEKLPDGMGDLLRETYTALNQYCYRLVAMGLRAIMEEVMNHKVKDIGGFEQKLKAMQDAGHLSPDQIVVIEPTLELGHAAIHRGHQPGHRQIEAALGVVESLLHLFFVQASVVKMLKAGVKPRKKRKSGKARPKTTSSRINPPTTP